MSNDAQPDNNPTSGRSEHARYRRGRIGRTIALVAVVALAVVFALALIPSGSSVISPSQAVDAGANLHGKFRDTTFAKPRRLFVPQDQVSSQKLLGRMLGVGESDGSVSVSNAAAATTRTGTAQMLRRGAAVGLREAAVAPSGAQIQSVEPGAAADKAGLKVGDVIIDAGGVSVRGVNDFAGQLRAAAGEDLKIIYLRDDQQRTTTIAVGADGLAHAAANQPAPEMPMAGAYELANAPATVSRGTELAVALAFLDAHGPGDLTGGRRLSAIGSLNSNLEVEPVADVLPLAHSAADAGVKRLLVPARQVRAVQRALGPDVEVVGVKSFNRALMWLCRNGGVDSRCQSPIEVR